MKMLWLLDKPTRYCEMRGNQNSFNRLDRGHPKAGLDHQFPSVSMVCSWSGACMEEVDLILMCSSCEKEKKASEFSKKNGCARGYSYKCKDCHNSYVRERWYPKNATKHRAASAKWTANNKARVKATALGLREEDVAIVLD